MHYSIIPASWHSHKELLSQIRRQVFIEEQQVPEELEWDEYDDNSYHVIALDDDSRPVACGRLKTDGQIGRMAVDRHWRNQGVGTAILENILLHAKSRGMQNLYLHAQTSAIPFYEKNGFRVCSEEFMDAGIPHRTMKPECD